MLTSLKNRNYLNDNIDAWNKNRDAARKFFLTALLCNDYLTRMNQTIIKALLTHVTNGRNRDFNIDVIQIYSIEMIIGVLASMLMRFSIRV